MSLKSVSIEKTICQTACKSHGHADYRLSKKYYTLL